MIMGRVTANERVRANKGLTKPEPWSAPTVLCSEVTKERTEMLIFVLVQSTKQDLFGSAFRDSRLRDELTSLTISLMRSSDQQTKRFLETHSLAFLGGAVESGEASVSHPAVIIAIVIGVIVAGQSPPPPAKYQKRSMRHLFANVLKHRWQRGLNAGKRPCSRFGGRFFLAVTGGWDHNQ